MPFHVKQLFGIGKSSDKINNLLRTYLDTELSVEDFIAQYSSIIKAKANSVRGNIKNVNNIFSRIKYLIQDANVHIVMLNSLPFKSENLCEDSTLKKINALRAINSIPGQEFGVIFDKYLDLQKEGGPTEEMRKHFESIVRCLNPAYEPDVWDESGLNTTYFANAKGGRRTRYRKVKARNTSRS